MRMKLKRVRFRPSEKRWSHHDHCAVTDFRVVMDDPAAVHDEGHAFDPEVPLVSTTRASWIKRLMKGLRSWQE